MATPFHDLDAYLALRRVSGLALSADGARLVTTITELNENGTEYNTAIWALDPGGQRPAHRLTRSRYGESSPAFTGNGDLLFVSPRAAPGASGEDGEPVASLWRLPESGGEAVQVLAMPGGIETVCTARRTETAVVTARLLPSARSVDDDRRLRELRNSRRVTAILRTGYPVRYWDKDLGPEEPHLVRASDSRDLTARPGAALRDVRFDISPDGRFLVTTWRQPGAEAAERAVLMYVDLDTGERHVIADDPAADLEDPVVSPDGSAVAFTREALSTADRPPEITLQYLRFGDQPVTLTDQWDRWPTSVTWSYDSTSLVVTADHNGRAPVFGIDVATSAVTQLTHDDFSYTDVVAAPDGAVYAVRSSVTAPPHPVRIDPDGAITVLPCVGSPKLPGTVTDMSATTSDGTRVRSWLVLPEDTAQAPLLVWIHGGPMDSWNGWTWGWNPWLMAAQGYAVLLPDPALSTGYGQQFVQRGWGAWGGPPFDDLMTITDAVCTHPRVDSAHIAAMGWSFGGYLANWVAGHTDRFAAIVSQAGLWAMDHFGPTTDIAYYWRRELTPEMAAENSPHHFVGAIRTPMLLIYGDKDYRVPIGQGMRLWYELLTESGLPATDEGSPHRFLYFPSEGHQVLAPQHIKLWYQMVAAFLAEHVLGQPGWRPELLG